MTKTSYPTYEEVREARIAAKRREAVSALVEAAAISRKHGGTLMVFGSLAEGGFDEDSDVDVALFGVSADVDINLSVEIDTFLRSKGISCDVVAERFAPPALLKRIKKHGREPGALE